MRVAFKNSFYNGKFDGIYGIGITFRSWLSGCFNHKAHVEIIFTISAEMLVKLRKVFPTQFLKATVGSQLSYSSIETDTDEFGNEVHGARFKLICYSHYDRWDFLPWNIKDKRFARPWPSTYALFLYCLSRVGKVKYDWEGILGQAVGLDSLDNSQETFCSEEAGELMGFMNNPSPAKLYNQMCAVLNKVTTKEVIK